MSAPFDLSNALKTPPTPLNGKPGGGKDGRRPPVNVRLDEAARRVIWIALTVSALVVLYLGWGLYAGPWSNPTWDHQTHAFRAQQLTNIGSLSAILNFAAIALIVAMLVVFLYDEGAGFALLGAGALFYVGVSLLTNQIFGLLGLRSTDATQEALRNFQTVGLIFGVPGLIWSVVDIWRRFRLAAEAALVRQANAKYAQASAARALGAKAPSRRLTPYQRQQRKYQIASLAVIIGEPLLVFSNISLVQNWMQGLLALMGRLSFNTSPQGVAQLHGSNGSLVLWTLLIALLLVVISQTLRLLEHIFFKGIR